MKQPEGTRIADIKKIQEIMHYHGLKEFKTLLYKAYYNASEEMKDIDSKISNVYVDEASKIGDETLEDR